MTRLIFLLAFCAPLLAQQPIAEGAVANLVSDLAAKGTGKPGIYTVVSFSATPAFPATSNTSDSFLSVLTGNVTSSTLTTPSVGETITHRICQDGTGSRTFVFPASYIGQGTISSAINACSNQTFLWDGTNATPRGPMTVDTATPAVFIPGSTSGGTTITGPATGAFTQTLPAITGTLLNDVSTATMTGKTFDTAGSGNSLSIAGLAVTANTGTGSIARATSPSLVTPALGVATATSLNKLTITAPASSATLTIPDGVTFTGPSASGTAATLGNTNTFTGRQDASGAASTSPAQTGTSLPGTCAVGDLYFKSNATAGQNLYSCATTNTWTQASAAIPKTIIFGSHANTTIPAATTSFAFGPTTFNTTEAARTSTASESGTLKNFYFVTTGAQPAGLGMQCWVRVNGADTAITISIAGGGGPNTFTDLVNTAAYTAGQPLTMKCTNSNAGSVSATIEASSLSLY